jgi:outer membrane protein assembly factor BamB
MSGVLGDGSSPAVVETVALDAATGAVRWRQPGDPSLGTADSIVLADWDAVRNSMRDMRMVRTADGRQRWALPRAAAVDSWTTTGVDPERPDRLITVDRAGRVEVRRLSDGGVVAGMTAPRPPGPQEGALQLYSSGAHLFVIRLDGAEQMITAYEVDTLRARWQRSYPSATGVFDCGALLCAGAADGEVDALDPATGAVRWRAAGWDYARSAGDGTLLVESHETGRHGLVDEATGRTLADFGPGFAALDPDTGTVLSLAPAQSLPPRLKLQRRTTSGEVVLLGAVPTGGADGCELAAGRLVCAGGGVLIVTDVG